MFFKDYWRRTGETGRTGDHIDLWNGKALASIGFLLTWVRTTFPAFSESHLDMSDLQKSQSILFLGHFVITKRLLLSLVFTVILFFAFVVSFAKSGYPLYADVFQSGILYEGETRAKHYAEYLSFVIFPVSLLSGFGVTFGLFRALKMAKRAKRGQTHFIWQESEIEGEIGNRPRFPGESPAPAAKKTRNA